MNLLQAQRIVASLTTTKPSHNQVAVKDNTRMGLPIKQQKAHRTVVSPQQAPVVNSRLANQ
jgi:hypothetical protein